MKFAAWYSVVVGVTMFAQWAFFIVAGEVPEFQTEPFRIAFHLIAEAVTALALIGSGAALLSGRRGAAKIALIASGMLIYTVINSPGYFAQLGQWSLVAMFAVLLVLTLISMAKLLPIVTEG